MLIRLLLVMLLAVGAVQAPATCHAAMPMADHVMAMADHTMPMHHERGKMAPVHSCNCAQVVAYLEPYRTISPPVPLQSAPAPVLVSIDVRGGAPPALPPPRLG